MSAHRKVMFQIEDDDGSIYEGNGPKENPWRGFAGGQASAGGYTVSCTSIKPTADYDETWLCRVDIQVERDDGSDTEWFAKFLMHPTFELSELILKAEPEANVAREYFWSYGWFVIGVVVFEAGQERVRLELDLLTVKNTSVDRAPVDWWNR